MEASKNLTESEVISGMLPFEEVAEAQGIAANLQGAYSDCKASSLTGLWLLHLCDHRRRSASTTALFDKASIQAV